RARPAMRLDGLGRIGALCAHPTRTREILVASGSTMQVWRFPQPEVVSMSNAELNGSEALAFSKAGQLAVASQNGVWLPGPPDEASKPRQALAAGRVVWDVDWFGDELVCTYDGCVAAVVLDMPEFGEHVAQLARHATCLDAGPIR